MHEQSPESATIRGSCSSVSVSRSDAADNCRPLRVLIMKAGQGKQKPVTMSQRDLHTLLCVAKKRLNLRSSLHTAFAPDGTEVDDAMLASMRNDTVLIVQ